ncbi:DedA family protein [Streptomyces bungoensis]
MAAELAIRRKERDPPECTTAAWGSQAEAFFTRHGGKVVTVAGFVEGLRQVNGVIAGTAEMPWPRFVAFDTLGAALWVGLWAGVGYFAGNHITSIYTEVDRYSTYLLVALVVLLLVLVARAVMRRRRTAD